MIRIFAFVALSVSAYISLMCLALFARVLLGVFSDGSGILASFLYVVTEPILQPIRRKIDESGIMQGFPLDLSVPVAMICLMALSFLLTLIS